MRRVIIFLSQLGLIAGLLTSSGILRAQALRVEQAAALWEQTIAAKGGRERLHATQNLLVSSATKYKKPPKGFQGERTVGLFVLPDKWWFWYDDRPGGFGLSIATYNFDQQMGWEVDDAFGLDTYKLLPPVPGSPHKSLEQRKSDRFKWRRRQFEEYQLIYLMETKWLQPKITGARIERVKGKKYDVIETALEGERFEFYLDQKTHLPGLVVIRVNVGLPKDYVDAFVLDDYVEVDGLKLPRKATRGSDKNETTYQVNVVYEEGLFARPPALTDRMDAWRTK